MSCAERTRSCARRRRICLPSADNTTTIRAGGARAPREMMVSFIDAHRGRYGVGPMCAQVPRAPSTDYEHKAREAEPARGPGRVRRDRWLCGEVRRVQEEHFEVYGVRKIWRQLRREGVAVARCTPAPESHRGVARLMRRMGLQAAVRGRRVKTTRAPVHSERPDDCVNREFKVSHPNALWVSDPRFHHSGAGSDPRFHGGRLYVATWRGFAYTAFVIAACARRIVGWRVSHSLHTDLALDALEPALHERRAPREGLVHHSPTRACSISRYATPSAWRRWASRPRWEAWATPATTRWPSPSSGCTRRNSSVIPAKAGTSAGRGVTARRGCTGTTTGACSDPSGMCLRLNSRHITTTHCMSRRWPSDSSKSPSGIPGAVQLTFAGRNTPEQAQRLVEKLNGHGSAKEQALREVSLSGARTSGRCGR